MTSTLEVGDVKDRMILLLSWVAFLWGLAALGIAFDDKYFIGGLDIERLITDTAIYVPAVIWAGLWVITGSPRILPWRT